MYIIECNFPSNHHLHAIIIFASKYFHLEIKSSLLIHRHKNGPMNFQAKEKFDSCYLFLLFMVKNQKYSYEKCHTAKNDDQNISYDNIIYS